MKAFFHYSRYVIVVPVIALLLAAVAVFVYGGFMAANVIHESFAHAIERTAFNAEGARALSVEMIELIDLFLLGTVLVLTGVGLQELFLGAHIDLPEWLSIDDLEQLKKNVVAVIIVMLGVLFAGAVASESLDGQSLFLYGAASALMIAALSFAVAAFARVRQTHVRLAGEEAEQAD
jgi:uncharacterized membrane protein YqhA